MRARSRLPPSTLRHARRSPPPTQDLAERRRHRRNLVPEVRVSCSGWNYADWRERVYPKDLPASKWLEHYATLFDTVEVNNTFYRLPRVEAVARWFEQSPPGFAFAVKASRYLTHVKRLRGSAPESSASTHTSSRRAHRRWACPLAVAAHLQA